MSDNIPSVVDKSLLDNVDKYVKSYPDGKDATYVIGRFIRETQRHIKLVKFCASKFQDVLDPAIYIKLLANVKEHDADKLTNSNIITTYAPYNLATFVKDSGLELKPEEECHIEADRETAWHEHYLVAKHHPEFWIEELKDTKIIPEDIQPLDTVNMSDEYIAEMIADWMAVGIVMENTAKEWYNKQRDVKWKFTEDQHKLITKLLEIETEELVTDAKEMVPPNNYTMKSRTSTESIDNHVWLSSNESVSTVQLNDIHLRLVNVNNSKDLQLFHAGLDMAAVASGDKQWTTKEVKKLFKRTNFRCYIITSDKNPIGVVVLIKKDESVAIHSFAIFKEYQHIGLGRLSLGAIVHYIATKYDTTIVTIDAVNSNTIALNLYKSFGFKITNSTDIFTSFSIDVIQAIFSVDDLKKFYRDSDYGSVVNGKRYTGKELTGKIIDKIRILTVEEQLKYHIGTCYDTVGLSIYFFTKWNVPYRTFLQSCRDKYDSSKGIWDDPTHTFVIYKENDIWKWLEGSWGGYMSNKLSDKNPDKLVNTIATLLMESKKQTCYIRELSNYPNLGQSIHTFYKTMMQAPVKFRIDYVESTESLGSYASLESLFGGGTVVKQLDPMHYSISNFPIKAFLMRIKRKYNTTRLTHLVQAIGISVFNRSKRTIKIHKFFIPELLYLLKSFHYPKALISAIEEHTWVGETSGFDIPVIDYNRVLRNITAKMYPHQEDFIKEYPELKTKSHLRGYLLSFEQGLGKTITALALMEALGKEKIIIICPKNTVYETWEAHIKKFFKTEQSVYAPYRNQDVNGDYRFYIFNYNAMDKLEDMLVHIDESNVGVIVDESHNFLRTSSDRTKMLIAISQQLDNADILLLSGTPIKCAGIELIPLMTVLDPYFDKEATETFKLSFGLNTNLATDVLNARLMKMMHRVTKEVMDLPDKVETTVMVKMKTGNEYTLSTIQKGLSDFITERRAYHFARMDEYEHDFMEVMKYLESIPGFYNRKYEWYFKEVTRLHKSGYDPFRDKDVIVEINTYEREVIEPALPSMMLKKFRYCKAAYKYLDLKIRGEALGQFLTRLRIKMTTEMMQAVNLGELVNDAVKKTVIFTSFTDTIEVCYDYLKKNGYDPLAVYGKTANELTSIVKTFQTNPKKNPLVASLKMISTGATLTAASQVIFLNKPWRSIEYAQASDRVHRIGQNTPVDIISLLLDTGDEPNLSTRMEDIINWSNKQYGEIVGVDNIMGIESLLPYDCTEQDDEEVVVSTEALSEQTDARRKKVVNYIIKVVNQLDPSGKNGKKYEEFFGKMTDKAFDEFMHLIKDGKYQLHITMPNMDSNLRMEHILKAADTVGVEFFHRLWLDDPVTGKRYLTPKAYPVFKVPVRRQQQFLDEKMSVPDGDTTIDGLSGQVTGPDKASAISNPEIRILHTRGLEKTLIEDVKVRGGDIHSYGEFRRQMEETGVGEISKLDPGSRARSAVIVDILLQGKHLDNNF